MADKAVIGWDVLTLKETPPTVNKEEGLASLSRWSLSGSSCPGGTGGSYGFQILHTLASLS